MKKRGRGMACVIYQTHAPIPNPTAACVEIAPDGTAKVMVGAADIGQGSTTVLAQIAAEELGLPVEAVSMITADTDGTPYCSGSYGNRVTFVAGTAVQRAAQEARRHLLEAVAGLLEASPEDLKLKDGHVRPVGADEGGVPLADAAGYSYFAAGVAPVGSASFSPEVTPTDPQTGQGAPAVAYTFGAQCAEVEVDTETGEVTVLRVTSAQDVGRAINPDLVKAQMEGGVSMGIGYALTEEVVVDDHGRVLNGDFVDYLIPTSLDVGEIETIIVETEEESGPYGARAVGGS